MGFLSRKKKNQPPAEPERFEPETVDHDPVDRAPAVAEEPHPIVEELVQMEQAVPERRFDEPAYEEEPYVEGEPQALEEEEPQGFEEEEHEVEEPVNAEHEEQADEEDDGRMKAVDLIAPTRLDFIRREEESAEEEAETAHPEVIAFANQKGGVAK
ncbi:MAG TPA: hypothetical protein VEB65_04395, partial [Solirubrobacterales bacterium]|nr:hypothetical protein [Solirubrobacterales bacterium]